MRFRDLFLALSLAAFATSARAGDGAGLNVLGFSADGERFAFEQFGSHDGSSFPYSELFVIDAATGADVEGAPFRTLIEAEPADVAAARSATAAKAKPILERLAIGRDGMVEAVNPAIRPFEEMLPMDIWPVQAREVAEMALPASAIGGATVRIATQLAASAYCKSITDGAARTIALALVRDQGAETALRVEKSPDAQGCPTAFGVAGVYLRPRPDGDVAMVVMVSAYPRGFEGPDRRFLAFAMRVPAAE